jgi:hypothetical protein
MASTAPNKTRQGTQLQCLSQHQPYTVLRTFHCAAPPGRRKTVAFLTARKLHNTRPFSNCMRCFKFNIPNTHSAESAHLCLVQFSEQTATIYLNSINRSDFAIQTQGFLCNSYWILTHWLNSGFQVRPRLRRHYSDSLRAVRLGVPTPVTARFFAPVQTCPKIHSASCTNSLASCLRGKAAGGCRWRPTPSKAKVKNNG